MQAAAFGPPQRASKRGQAVAQLASHHLIDGPILEPVQSSTYGYHRIARRTSRQRKNKKKRQPEKEEKKKKKRQQRLPPIPCSHSAVVLGACGNPSCDAPFSAPLAGATTCNLEYAKLEPRPASRNPPLFSLVTAPWFPKACRRCDWIAATLEESCMAHWFSPTSPNFTLFAMI